MWNNRIIEEENFKNVEIKANNSKRRNRCIINKKNTKNENLLI